jgi:hypothetical protein
MDYQIRCACGGFIVVSEQAAGASLLCSCGRKIDVPSLGALREGAGLPAHQLSARLVIENLLAHGELPGHMACAQCNGATDQSVTITAECEKSWSGEHGWIASIFLILVAGVWSLLVFQSDGRERGSNVILHLPVRMCRRCRRQLPGTPITALKVYLACIVIACSIIGMFVVNPWIGLLAVPILALLGIAVKLERKRQQTVIRDFLRQEPLYEQLLKDYPDANLMLVADT